ncbi:uncharacterized protein LOC105939494 isoform X3 [Fundulus heteroclitus]|uniref:uncharacterized protein LOC105939494 isoform X3 n=1 Tax=Fundulus heteroclitus TaxID=8078 RepID=UPI00165BB92B|nr:uncharacterized protein LOC105939494 isoform X3 [Fundulus heteroclitus]
MSETMKVEADDPGGLSSVSSIPAASSSELEQKQDSKDLMHQMLVIKEEVLNDWNSSLVQQDSKPPLIKKEKEKHWVIQEGTLLAMKRKSEDEELSELPQIKTEDNADTEDPSSSSTDQMKTEPDGEDYGGTETDRNPDSVIPSQQGVSRHVLSHKQKSRQTRVVDEERLIVQVENNSILYDAAHPFYKDNNRKDITWAEIATMLGGTAEQCKTKWRALRDSFVKCRKKGTLPSGSAGGTTKEWKFEKNMSFLIPYLQPRRRNLQAPLLCRPRPVLRHPSQINQQPQRENERGLARAVLGRGQHQHLKRTRTKDPPKGWTLGIDFWSCCRSRRRDPICQRGNLMRRTTLPSALFLS